jgi:hypothetical protein
MNYPFLTSLLDTSGNTFLFGTTEAARKSIFLQSAKEKEIGLSNNYVILYHGNELSPKHKEPVLRNNYTADWIFPVLLLILAFFAWIKFFYNRYFQQLIKAFLNTNLTNQIVRDENIFFQRISIYLSVVFNLIAALFIYLLSIQYHWTLGNLDTGFTRFIFFVIVVSAIYALKYLVLKICGWLFEQEKEISMYIFNIFLINNILGIALLPFICLLAFNGSVYFSGLLNVSFILIAAAFGWRIFRGIQIGFGSPTFSPLYLFLYLCTLEIAPLMVLIRIIVQ